MEICGQRASILCRTASACVKEDLDEKFKDRTIQLRLVFVCAMWMTGFDVPTVLDASISTSRCATTR